MKTCSKCKISKGPSGFSKKAEAKDGLQSSCKGCDAEYKKENSEAESARRAEWRQANRESIAAKQAEYYQENREARLAKEAKYQKANPDKCRAISAKRRAAKLQRTPAWVDFEAIKAVYAEAHRLEELDGIPRHVDHVIPLQGELVSGLHIASNLKILTAQENLSKSNKFVPH